MNKNIGGIERVVRIVAGIGLLSLMFAGPKTMWGLIGVIPLFTGALNWCPMYTVLGVNRHTK